MAKQQERHRVAVILNQGQDAKEWHRRYEEGSVLDRTPYGYDVAADEFDMRWSQSFSESPTIRRIRERIGLSLGFDLVHAWRNRHLIGWADVVWTHTEREHLAVAAVQFFRRPRRRTPVIAQSVWLWDNWSKLSRAKRSLVKVLLRSHPIECTLSRVNREMSATQVPGRRVVVIPFGTSIPADANAGSGENLGFQDERPLVLARGNDVDRDWELFVEVARSMPQVDFRIASGRQAARNLPWPSNAICEPARSLAEVADLYRQAKVVAVPLKLNKHASGATTCIEAVGSGCLVVATNTGGIDDYLPPDARLVGLGDVDGWVRALDELVALNSTGDREFVSRNGLTQLDYVARFVAITKDLIGERPIDGRVSEFASMG